MLKKAAYVDDLYNFQARARAFGMSKNEVFGAISRHSISIDSDDKSL
jgi:hypothetical protein